MDILFAPLFAGLALSPSGVTAIPAGAILRANVLAACPRGRALYQRLAP